MTAMATKVTTPTMIQEMGAAPPRTPSVVPDPPAAFTGAAVDARLVTASRIAGTAARANRSRIQIKRNGSKTASDKIFQRVVL